MMVQFRMATILSLAPMVPPDSLALELRKCVDEASILAFVKSIAPLRAAYVSEKVVLYRKREESDPEAMAPPALLVEHLVN